MQITSSFEQSISEAYRWREETGIAWKITLAILMAGLTGLLAQLRIPLPFSPIPLTGQTFAVLVAGVLLGRKWGGISLAIYAVLGIAGVPWFNGSTSGYGATTGYLLGFILAGLFVGYMTDRKNLTYPRTFGIMLFANFVLIYLPGLIGLGLWLNLFKGTPTAIPALIAMGIVPFVAGDIIKASLAALVARVLRPRTQ